MSASFFFGWKRLSCFVVWEKKNFRHALRRGIPHCDLLQLCTSSGRKQTLRKSAVNTVVGIGCGVRVQLVDPPLVAQLSRQLDAGQRVSIRPRTLRHSSKIWRLLNLRLPVSRLPPGLRYVAEVNLLFVRFVSGTSANIRHVRVLKGSGGFFEFACFCFPLL